MLETLAKVFFEFAKIKFYFVKISRKLGIIIIICKGLPPGVRQEKGTKKIASSSSQISKIEALREPNTKAPGLRFSFSAPADGRGL